MTRWLKKGVGFFFAHLPLCLFALSVMVVFVFLMSQRREQARESEGARLVLHDMMWKLKSGQPLLAANHFSPVLKGEEERFARDWEAVIQELGAMQSWKIAHVGVIQEKRKIRLYCLITFERGKRYARFRFFLEPEGWKVWRISGSGLMFPDDEQDLEEKPEEG
ncbi:MAG: hypothetical protein KIT45_10975 [Fimbriimonadia bacterium]|nr:hypothetical protein [Fimbriimonadia bacterium]